MVLANALRVLLVQTVPLVLPITTNIRSVNIALAQPIAVIMEYATPLTPHACARQDSLGRTVQAVPPIISIILHVHPVAALQIAVALDFVL